MSEEEIFKTVKEVIVDQLGVDEEIIKMDATFVEDLSADSLDIVELIMDIEDKFEIEIPDSDAEKMVTVSDVVDYIKVKKEE
jgi:acyl carrier protein